MKKFGYYLAMSITGVLFVLLILSASIIAESISGWFKYNILETVLFVFVMKWETC